MEIDAIETPARTSARTGAGGPALTAPGLANPRQDFGRITVSMT